MTQRQIDVAILDAMGLNKKEISWLLGIRLNMVYLHLKNFRRGVRLLVPLLSLLSGCVSRPQNVRTMLPEITVERLTPSLVGQTQVFVLPWVYPNLTNAYWWSLQSSTDLKTWTTVTNYPFGYTNDVWWTNDWSTFRAFRMKGHL